MPKTQDIPNIAGNVIGAATASAVIMNPDDPDLPGADRDQLKAQIDAEKEMSDVNIVRSIGSSLAFEIAIVLLAMWWFMRQDF